MSNRSCGTTVLCALMAAGCSTLPPRTYEAPQLPSGQLTEVTLVTSGTEAITVSVFQDALTCSGYQLLEAPSAVHPGPGRKVLVERGKPFTVMGMHATAGGGGSLSYQTCYIPVTFVPTQPSITLDIHRDERGCGVRDLSSPAITTMVKRQFVVGWDYSSSWCGKLSDPELRRLTGH
jgi:hypothetical protein